MIFIIMVEANLIGFIRICVLFWLKTRVIMGRIPAWQKLFSFLLSPHDPEVDPASYVIVTEGICTGSEGPERKSNHLLSSISEKEE